jgi:CheY-like chemotaxis protein
MLSVTDSGVGMDKETQDHIFEPFFTTKDQDKGTGLGLSVVYGVVNQSGGHIAVSSELEKGTTFKIYLPLAEQAVEKQTRSAVATNSLKGSETILVVEDEASLRDLIRTLLAESGYRVLDTGGGPQALEIARQHQESIHLLLTDVVLPGISGTTLADEIVKQRPEVKVLFMSGYIGHHAATQGMLEAGTLLLQKPFEAEVLRYKVREALNTAL